MNTVPTAPDHTGHRPQLDGLRCLAVLAVLVTHFAHPNPLPWIFRYVDFGFLGVQLFFVLSGFLITRILLECGDRCDQDGASRFVVVRRFYARRFLRIFPVYYLIVLTAVLVNVAPAREIWPWLITYTSNFYEAFYQRNITYFGHFWTLAIEEQFYLVWPWLVLFAPRRWLGVTLALAIGLAPIARDVTLQHLGESGWSTMPWFSLDTLAIGAALALAFHHASSRDALHRTLQRVILPLGVSGYLALNVIAVGGSTRLLAALQEGAYAMICCWLIASADRGFGGLVGRALSLQPIVYLGRISYGVYAYHMFMPWLLVRVFRRAGLVFPDYGSLRFVLAGVATVALASVSWYFLERPINELKRHFPYSPWRSHGHRALAMSGGRVGAATGAMSRLLDPEPRLPVSPAGAGVRHDE